jgi:hypothetical protein
MTALVKLHLEVSGIQQIIFSYHEIRVLKTKECDITYLLYCHDLCVTIDGVCIGECIY